LLTYDTGALIAAEASRRSVWALHEAALRRGFVPTVPTVVLAQAWRGSRQVQLSRLLKGCRIDPLTEDHARAAGAACAASGTADIVDATVVVTAAARGDTVVTTDPDDLIRIADATDAVLDLHVV
jgi:predicted nucleic acid-binding protein